METEENLIHNAHTLLNRSGFSLCKDFEYQRGKAILYSKGSHMVLITELMELTFYEFLFMGNGLIDKWERFEFFDEFPMRLYVYNSIKPFDSNIKFFKKESERLLKAAEEMV